MQAANPIQLEDFNRLQKVVNNVVSNVGILKAIDLFEGIDNNSTLTSKEDSKVKCIINFIISKTIEVYHLNEDKYHTSEIIEYRDARMIAFHVIKSLVDISYGKLAEVFGRTKRSVMYYTKKVDDFLTVSNHHRKFILNYMSIERSALDFIAKLK